MTLLGRRLLMATEGVEIDITADAIEEIATLSAEINAGVDNIGARRLQTAMPKLVEEISFKASERSRETLVFTPEDARARVGVLAKSADLAKFIFFGAAPPPDAYFIGQVLRPSKR
jgi:ATP-dependent HslUV protease ATP-binding subunit HslU